MPYAGKLIQALWEKAFWLFDNNSVATPRGLCSKNSACVGESETLNPLENNLRDGVFRCVRE